ncbi:MAG: tRNA methyltransferase [Alphaproteobacteria bacterium]|nr:MAG: tRNA methyltransferase [Alphaproteobacteria bacterium]
MRLSACFGTHLHVVEPCGFVWRDRNLLRAGMDYMDMASVSRYDSWEHFRSIHEGRRMVRISPEAETSFLDFVFFPDDILLLGRESCGFSRAVTEQTPLAVKIPMVAHARSLNVAIAGACVISEALRQGRYFDEENKHSVHDTLL